MILRETLENLMNLTYKVNKTDCRMRAYLSSDQNNIPNATGTLVQLDTEVYDDNSDFNTTTHLYTPPVNGTYLITAGLSWRGPMLDQKYYGGYILAGAVTQQWAIQHCSDAGQFIRLTFAVQCQLTTSQTLGLYAYHADGTNNPDVDGGAAVTHMEIHLLSV